MSIETLLVVLLVWAVGGLLAAIAFGKAIQTGELSPDDETLVSSNGAIKYFRRNKRKSQAEHAETGRQRTAAEKRVTS